jgi:hypothetical protein
LAYLFRFADDFLLLACNLSSGKYSKQILRFVLLIGILDIPLKWSKTRGGLSAEFIGYLFQFESFTGGLSQRRASWICSWCRKIATDGVVVTRELRGGLGRISFSAVLWRFLLPYLGPFYAWVSVHENSSAWMLPPALILLLRWIATAVEENPFVTLRHCQPVSLGMFFKADAKAEGSDVVVGGFASSPGANLSQCPGFSLRLTPSSAPWAFHRHGEAYRVIATLELYATLLCIMLFVEVQAESRVSTLFITGVTDNAGNVAMLEKGSTSKYPLYVFNLELTEQLKARRINLDLRWMSRDCNVAADALTNGDFSGFSMERRIVPNLSKMDWKVLPRLLEEAAKLEKVLIERKALHKDAQAETKSAFVEICNKKRKITGLRVTDPW